ncbi:MAG: DnaD domain protein [Syntrophomonas sp.]|nr:DnaD domain protein [Syntrophomonas sp.]
MQHESASLEIMRWGYAHLPGAIFFYAKELDLDMEDIGILSAIFYAFENTKPLFQSGVRAGQILQSCSSLTTHKLSRKLAKLSKQEIIEMGEGSNKNFGDKIIQLEPLMSKLEQLVMRDHPQIMPAPNMAATNNDGLTEHQIQEYQTRIQELELQLELQTNDDRRPQSPDSFTVSDVNYKRVADFISKKTGNLLSVKMENELRSWLGELGFTPEFLLCMLELALERNITNPRDITKIARDLKEYSINNVDGLNVYFKNYVDQEKNRVSRLNQFDPDINEFGNFTGLDMNAEARKKVYYKWRYDWGFTHNMIMKAGELMCQRTKNGGLEYIDSVLNNWMSKEIRSLTDVEKEIAAFKNRPKTGKTFPVTAKNLPGKRSGEEYEYYVPPEILAELKSKA